MNNKKFIPSFITIALIIIVIIGNNPVTSCCYYEVGTFESDYTSIKNSFYKGEIVYGRGNDYCYGYPLRLRIVDPNGNIVYYSDESTFVVYGMFFLNETATVGTWIIQLGIYKSCKWQWLNSSERTAYFTVSDKSFTLDVNVDGDGSVIVEPELSYYPYGSLVNLTAIPSNGWTFNGWTGDIYSSNNFESIVMYSNKSVTATFVQNQYELIVNVIGNGTVVKEPDKTLYLYGDVVSLSCLNESGWVFDHWEGDILGDDNPAIVTIDNDKNVTAVFSELQGDGGDSNNSGGGGRSKTKAKPNKPPVADLSAGEPYIGFVEEEIEFNGSLSYDLDGKIVEYKWFFGDETTGFGVIAKHVYLAPGEYKVELKVKDNRGGIGIDETVAVILKPNTPPSKPVITGPTTGFVNISYDFSIFSMDDDLDVIKYIIDWGDGNTSESGYILSGILFNTTYKWLKPGQYIIIVKADDGKTSTTQEFTINILEQEKPVFESSNFILIILAIIALLLLLLFLLLAKKDNDDEKNQ